MRTIPVIKKELADYLKDSIARLSELRGIYDVFGRFVQMHEGKVITDRYTKTLGKMLVQQLGGTNNAAAVFMHKEHNHIGEVCFEYRMWGFGKYHAGHNDRFGITLARTEQFLYADYFIQVEQPISSLIDSLRQAKEASADKVLCEVAATIQVVEQSRENLAALTADNSPARALRYCDAVHQLVQ